MSDLNYYKLNSKKYVTKLKVENEFNDKKQRNK